jgi:hypothetical protein
MAARKQSSLTIDEAFQRFYRQEKGKPHVACEWFNQALRDGLTLWCDGIEVKPDYFASYFRVTIEQTPNRSWTAKMKTVASATMPPADRYEWTVSAPRVNSLLKSESGRKRGRKPKFDWASIKREIAQRCIDKKTGRMQVPVPDNEGKLAKALLDWCGTKFDEIPSDPAMRAAVKEICAMLRPD